MFEFFFSFQKFQSYFYFYKYWTYTVWKKYVLKKIEKLLAFHLRWNNKYNDIKTRRNLEKIRAPDGIWTHDPPCSSRML